ncbi:hypothetical protein [Bacterioplanoides sp.]|uniref:hypothetical protein n=1 Tax=Bacterioplanoides sp. TaxID=2066072 RepID=UPI003B003D5E
MTRFNLYTGLVLCCFCLNAGAFTTPVYQPESFEFDLPAVPPGTQSQSLPTSQAYRGETQVDKDVMDRSRDWLVEYLNSLSGNIDSFFIDTFFSEEIVSDDVKGSRAKLSFYTRRELGEPVDYKFGLSVKVALPNTNERLKLLVESEDEDALREGDPIESVENVEYTAALRFIINETDKWKTNIDGGIRWGLPPDPFVRLRARRYAYFSEWELKATQRFSYFTSDGWESESDLQMNYPINITKQFRVSTRADYLLNDGFFELGYGAGLYHRLSTRSAIGFVANANGDTEFGATFDAYAAGVRYRRQIWKDYVFAELSPEIIWTRDTDYESTPVIMFRLETVFSQ